MVVGNPQGDVTLVEFFDYNCGYCKRSVETVAKLIEGDPKLRVVLKDFAILGPDSVEAAQVANAARMQLSSQKFWDFHRKLLGTKGHIGKAQAMAVARWLDQALQSQPWMAGERFTIADITAFCALEFARGLMKFVPGDEGMTALQAWRDRMNERPSARA